jgi:hypothetical protein
MKRHQPLIPLLPALLVGLCLATNGCVAVAPSVSSERAESPAALRETTPPGQLFGITGQARDIERNLGVR